MAFTVDPVTYVISVPKSDLTLVSGTLYELDTEQFRLDLRDWEDSEEGIVQPKTHDHATTYTVAGVTYARGIIVLPPYSIEFEDGQYSIILKNSNNNIFDIEDGILVQNQVQVIPTNAAGLIVSVTAGSGLTPGEASDLSTAASESTTAAAQASIAAAEAAFARKLQSNRAVIAADDLSVIIYDDDSVTPLLTFDVSEDKRERTPTGYGSFLWTADGAAAVDGSDGIYWLPLNVADTWEYTTRDAEPVLKVAFATSSSSEFRGLAMTGWPAIDYARSHKVSGRFYTDWFSYYSFVSGWGRFNPDGAIATQFSLLNEEGTGGDFKRVSLIPQLPDPVTQIPTLDYVSSPDQSWLAGWLEWEYEWDAVAREMSATAWQPPAAKPGTPLVTLSDMNVPAEIQPASLHIAIDRRGSGGSTTEIAWLKLEYLS